MIKSIRWLPAHSLLRRHTVKPFSQKVTQKTDRVQKEDVPSDPRPPWVYSASAGLRVILIPGEQTIGSGRVHLEHLQVSYSMPYFLLTLETGSMCLCPYVIITL